MSRDRTRNDRIAVASLLATIVGTIATVAAVPGAGEWFLSARGGASSLSVASMVPFAAGQPITIDKERLERLCHARLTHDDLSELTSSELEVLRNSIYALHGRSFERRDLRQLFGRQSWYRVDSGYSDARLTKTDWYNLDLIRRAEKAPRRGGA